MPETATTPADRCPVVDGGAPHLPTAAVLGAATTRRLLEMMEEYERDAEARPHLCRAAAEASRRIGATLAQRLGIHCEVYAALLCHNSTAAEWRLLFPGEPPAGAAR